MNVLEPIATSDVFFTDAMEAEKLGDSMARLTIVAKRRSLYEGGGDDHEVVTRLVGERKAFLKLALVLMRLAKGKATGPEFDDMVISALDGGPLQ
jgi:hypothetical protein